MAETKLKNCPFCNAEAKVYQHPFLGTWSAYCTNGNDCGASIRGGSTKEDVIIAWNKRTPPTSEQIVEYIEKTMAENREAIDKLEKKYGFK